MAAGTAEVGTLRVRSAAGDTPAVRLAASAWLGGAELHPRELPPSAVLIVRRMTDPLPGKLPAGGPTPPDPAWERAARASLGDFCRRAARPARGPVPPGAEAVLFADEAEMLACLALDLARGNAPGRWWWSLVLRRRGTRDLPSLFAAEPTRVPALFHHLEQWHRAAEICESLSEAEAKAILQSMAGAHGTPDLAKALSAPAGSAGILPAGGKGGKTAPEPAAAVDKHRERPAWSPQPAWQRRLRAIPDVTRLAPAQRVLLAAALALFEEPGRARSAAFASEVRTWWEEGAAVERAEGREGENTETEGKGGGGGGHRGPSPPVPLSHPHSLPPGEGAPPPEEARWRERSRRTESPPPDLHSDQARPLLGGRDARAADRGEIGEGLEAMPTLTDKAAPPSSAEAAAEPSSAEVWQGTEPLEIETEEPVTEEEVQAAEDAAGLVFEEGVATEIAGLFYLINLMTALNIPDAFEEVGAWGILEAIARALLGPLPDDLATDPVWRVLALLDGREFPPLPVGRGSGRGAWDQIPPLPEEGRGWERGPGGEGLLRLRLAQGLGLDPARPEDLPPLLLLRPGRVHVTSTHVDVVMDLASISLPVRISGLDRDPGWLPAFGRVIQFHFR